MCSPATCHSCGRATWAGCGMHAAQVLARVPAEARCACHEEAATSSAPGSAFGR